MEDSSVILAWVQFVLQWIVIPIGVVVLWLWRRIIALTFGQTQIETRQDTFEDAQLARERARDRQHADTIKAIDNLKTDFRQDLHEHNDGVVDRLTRIESILMTGNSEK